jgi:hypothetical protein
MDSLSLFRRERKKQERRKCEADIASVRKSTSGL